ncbi:MAG: ABC transporter ATP-binding protein [Acidimicrobiia bacterium]|nr:ABC transporter ATP-binding protein [Acidimicrobiia bacterium]MDH4307213.1 ABC transporter ATP-binding protein [Acidimicrobiia bacterium]MDH5292840.1 ABC transporter ATP-binding protein [Acidimicrobiia bacterium]
MQADTPIIELRSVSKSFGDTHANRAVDFDLMPGEIHVLLGENGAGKTTLMNILFGHLQPDSGTILVQGDSVDIGSPSDAIARGIGMVHQHFSLVPSFTVAENVMLGVGKVTDLTIDSRDIEQAVTARAEELHMPIDAAVTVVDLPVDLQQRVEIIKAMYRGARVLIMDEPTSLLGPTQIANLLEILTDLRGSGHSIILVTHKLAEVMEVADRVTVLRRGERVASMRRGEFDERSLARAMTGQEREPLPERTSLQTADGPALRVDRLTVPSTHGHGVAVSGLSLEVKPGEILGIAGVEGNGQRELVDAIIGLAEPQSGTVTVGGIDVTHAPPADRRSAGLGAIPEDRHGLGLVLDMTLAENLAITELASGGYRSRGVINWQRIHADAERLLTEYDVRPPDPKATAGSLSGGNQQKVVLAREMARGPKVLVADNPTWGLDVGAIDYVHRKLIEMRDAGGAVLLLTLDLEELYKLSDRVVVIYRGQQMLEAPASKLDQDALAMAMAGRTSD